MRVTFYEENFPQGEHSTRGTFKEGNFLRGELFMRGTFYEENFPQGEHSTGVLSTRGT